jgi:hypothetical protein
MPKDAEPRERLDGHRRVPRVGVEAVPDQLQRQAVRLLLPAWTKGKNAQAGRVDCKHIKYVIAVLNGGRTAT